MSELDDPAPRWVDWITQLGNSLDIDVSRVDVAAIHRLTGEIAARFERPLAPVGALLMGLVMAANPAMEPEQARALIVANLPSSTSQQETNLLMDNERADPPGHQPTAMVSLPPTLRSHRPTVGRNIGQDGPNPRIRTGISIGESMAPAEDEQRWQNWVDELSRSLDVDPSRVDIPAVLGLTREIAHRFDRPMAPVGSFMLGMALAGNPAVSLNDLMSRIESSLPAAEESSQ